MTRTRSAFDTGALVRSVMLVVAAGAGCGRIRFEPMGSSDASSDGPPIDGLDPSLVLWFPFDGGTGNVVNGGASSCFGRCPQAVPGKTGMGMQFDGVGTCLQFADSGATHLQAFTLALWANKPANGEYSLFAKPFAPASSDFNIWQIEDHMTQQLGFTTHNAGRHDVLFTTSPAPSAWHHLAVTFDGAVKRIYIDGALRMATPEPDPVQYDASPIVIGCDINTGGILAYPYLGVLDDVRFYRRPLTDAEVATLAQ